MEVLSLDDVLALGGDKDDYDMLADVDSSVEDETEGRKNTTSTSSEPDEKELRSLIKSLGLDKMRDQVIGDDVTVNQVSVDSPAVDASKNEGKEVAAGKKAKKEIADDKQMADKKKSTKKKAATSKADETTALEPNKAKDKSVQTQKSGINEQSTETEKVQSTAKSTAKDDTKTKKKSKAGKTSAQQSAGSEEAKVFAETDESRGNRQRYGTLEPWQLAKYSNPYKGHKNLLLTERGKWFEQSLPDLSAELPLAPDEAAKMEKYAQAVLEFDSKNYQDQYKQDHASDLRWMHKAAAEGSLDDKMAASDIFIQDSAAHRLSALEKMVQIAKGKGKRESLLAIEHLQKLFMTWLLPSDRKLRTFRQQPLTNPGASNKHLALWYYESALKLCYANYLGALQTHGRDSEQGVKLKVVNQLYELLLEKPEQEKSVLVLLVNKMGDLDRQVVSKVSFVLTQLVRVHTEMKLPVVEEMEQLLYRANVEPRTQFYCICYLNQLVLSRDNKTLATKLVALYFDLFTQFTNKGDLSSKMLSALLTGVNRAFPYADVDDEVYNKHIDALFKVVHVGTPQTSTQALMLLFQTMQSRRAVTDRYYRALYCKLRDAMAVPSLHSASFLNVLYKSLLVDSNLPRMQAFVKRVLQLCTTQQPNFICAALYLISEVAKKQPRMLAFVTGEESDDEEKFVDVDEETSEGDSKADTGAQDKPNANKPSATDWLEAYQPYKPAKLDPQYAGADRGCLWELSVLEKHYHPSVVVFASSLAQGKPIEYIGDPLQDFTFVRFLDKFVFKNPKKNPPTRGISIMQKPPPLPITAVNTKEFIEQAGAEVQPDDVFFYKYFKERQERQQRETKPKEKKKEGDDDDLADLLVDEEDEGDDDALGFSDDDLGGEDSGEGSYDYDDLETMLGDGDSDSATEEPDKLTQNQRTTLEELALEPSESEDEGEVAAKLPKGKKRVGSTGNRQNKKQRTALYADAEDFAEMLESSGKVDHHKQLQWEERTKHWSQKKSGRGRRPGGRGRR